jgi:hypothetical protein
MAERAEVFKKVCAHSSKSNGVTFKGEDLRPPRILDTTP